MKKKLIFNIEISHHNTFHWVTVIKAASTQFDNDTLFLSSIIGVIGTGHYCEERRFPADVRDLAKALVPITRRLWQLTKVGNLSQSMLFHIRFDFF